MSGPALKIANYDVDPSTGVAQQRNPTPSGIWISIAEAARRAGYTNPSAVRGLIYRRGWESDGLARKNADGEWSVDEAALPAFAPPATLSAYQRARQYDWNAVPEKARQIALFRLSLLEDCDQYIRSSARGRGREEVIGEFLKSRRLNLSVRSYRRIEKDFATMGVPDGLLDRRLDGTPKKSTYAEFYELFRAAYLEYGQANVTAVYRLICGKVRTQNLGIDVPSDRQIRNFAATIPLGEKIYHRQGPKAFDDRCAAYIERDWTMIKVEEHGQIVTRPMESNDIWCADHHPCDVIVEREGKLLRPWLSAWMDMRSRRIVGRVITWRDPNMSTVLLALRDGVMRNGMLLPAWCFTDNGKDYDAWMWDGRTKRQRQKRIEVDPEHFGGVYQQLQIGHLHARPYNAKAKPIERFFRTFEEQFGVFEPTYCGRSTDTKPERLAERLERGLAPAFEDFERRALAWIDDAYANQPSDAQGVDGSTPNAVYAANLGTRRMTTTEQLDCCLMLSKQLKVGRNGIQWQHRTYGKADPAIRHLFGQTVLLRIDPADVTTAQVWDATGRQRLCTVTRNDLRAVSTVSDDQEKEAIRTQAKHNKQLKAVQKRGMRKVVSPAEILIEDAIQQTRKAAAATPPEPPTYGGIKLIQTGIDAQSIDDQPALRKAAGGETDTHVRAPNSTLAAFAEDDE